MTADNVTTNTRTDTKNNSEVSEHVSVRGSSDMYRALWRSQSFSHDLIKESSCMKPIVKVIEQVPQSSQQSKDIKPSDGRSILGYVSNEASRVQDEESLLSSGDDVLGSPSASLSTTPASNAMAYRNCRISKTSGNFSSQISLASTSSLSSSSERLRSRLEASVAGLKELATLREKHELLVSRTMTAARQITDRSSGVSMGERIGRRRSQSKISKSPAEMERSRDDNKENQAKTTDMQRMADRCSNPDGLVEARSSLDSRTTWARQSLNNDSSLQNYTTPKSEEKKVSSAISEIIIPPALPPKLYRSQSLTGVSVLQAAGLSAVKRPPDKADRKSGPCRKQSIFEGIDLRNTSSGPLRAVLLQYSPPGLGSEVGTDSSSTETLCNDSESDLTKVRKYSSNDLAITPISRKHRTNSSISVCSNNSTSMAFMHSQDTLHKRHSLTRQMPLNRRVNIRQNDNDSLKRSECKPNSGSSNKVLCSNSSVSLSLDSGENSQQGTSPEVPGAGQSIEHCNRTDLAISAKTTRPPIPHRRPRLPSQRLVSEVSGVSTMSLHPSGTSRIGHASDQGSDLFSGISQLNANSGSHADVGYGNKSKQIAEENYVNDPYNSNPRIKPAYINPRMHRVQSCHSINTSVCSDLQPGNTCTSRQLHDSVFSSCANLNAQAGKPWDMIGDDTRHIALQNDRISGNVWLGVHPNHRSSLDNKFKHSTYQNVRTNSDDNSSANIQLRNLTTPNDNSTYLTHNMPNSGTDENNNKTFHSLSKGSEIVNHRSSIGCGPISVKQPDSRSKTRLSVWDVEETAI